MTADAHTAPYAYPLQTVRTPYGPHDPAGNPPPLVESHCAGRHPVCNREAHPAHGRHTVLVATSLALQRQRQQINDVAREAVLHNNMEDRMPSATQDAHAGTWQDPKPMLSGFCGITADPSSHGRCRTHYTNPGAEGASLIFRCRCDKDGCACNSDVAVAQDAIPVPLVATPEPATSGTSWSADEVTDLMVELDACPLCDKAWNDHTFTDDDRVEC